MPDHKKLAAFGSWLQEHGNKLRSIHIARDIENFNFVFYPGESWGWSGTLLLPLHQLQWLQQLELQGITVEHMEANNQHSCRSLCDLTALTTLKLHCVQWLPRQPFAELATLTNLRKLGIVDFKEFSDTGHTQVHAKEAMNKCISAALATLTQLTHLSLPRCLRDEELSVLAKLRHLQELELREENFSAAGLHDIPLSITSLKLCGLYNLTLSPLATPRVAQLTNLQSLSLDSLQHLDPNTLVDMMSLTHLSLHSVHLAKQTYCPGPENDGPEILLALLPQLTRLRHLAIVGEDSWCMPALQRSTSLVNNMGLTYLDLRRTCLPCYVIQHMFPHNQQRTALKVLKLGNDYHRDRSCLLPNQEHLVSLVACCPSLQELSLVNALGEVQLTTLQQRTGLTKLALGGYRVKRQWLKTSLKRDLLQLTSLQSLCLIELEDLAEVMLDLRHLTQLTSLTFGSCYLYQGDNCDDFDKRLVSQVSLTF